MTPQVTRRERNDTNTLAKPQRIDRKLFFRAFNRDTRFHDRFAQRAYLDRRTGDVLWLYENDEDAVRDGVRAGINEENRARIECAPEQHLEIPGLDHDDHHQILRDFLESDWTQDERELDLARRAYDRSIGGWIIAVENDHAVKAYFEYKESALQAKAQQFLRDHRLK